MNDDQTKAIEALISGITDDPHEPMLRDEVIGLIRAAVSISRASQGSGTEERDARISRIEGLLQRVLSANIARAGERSRIPLVKDIQHALAAAPIAALSPPATPQDRGHCAGCRRPVGPDEVWMARAGSSFCSQECFERKPGATPQAPEDAQTIAAPVISDRDLPDMRKLWAAASKGRWLELHPDAPRQIIADAVAACQAHLSALPEQTGERWQTIAAAPTDGTLVDVWLEKRGEKISGERHADIKAVLEDGRVYWCDKFGNSLEYFGTVWSEVVTHFMPRPAPPAGEAP